MAKTPDEIKADAILRARAWYRDNKPRAKATRAAYAKKNRIHLNAKTRERYQKNKVRITTKRQVWVAKNRARVAASKTKYRDNNRDRVRRSAREYLARRRETDINYKIRDSLRGRIWSALKSKRGVKAATTMKLTGCDGQFLRGYLEARFLPGMSWANHGQGKGKWHIDHRIPCAEFDLLDPAQQRQCFSYTNLKPMWGIDNVRKGAKRPPTHQAELI